jgi:hypothetical protein
MVASVLCQVGNLNSTWFLSVRRDDSALGTWGGENAGLAEALLKYGHYYHPRRFRADSAATLGI